MTLCCAVALSCIARRFGLAWPYDRFSETGCHTGLRSSRAAIFIASLWRDLREGRCGLLADRPHLTSARLTPFRTRTRYRREAMYRPPLLIRLRSKLRALRSTSLPQATAVPNVLVTHCVEMQGDRWSLKSATVLKVESVDCSADGCDGLAERSGSVRRLQH